MQLLSEVRNIIQQRDIDEFNELTIHKEIKSRKVRWMLTEKPFLHGKLLCISVNVQERYSMADSDSSQEGSYPVMLRTKHAMNVRFSPI